MTTRTIPRCAMRLAVAASLLALGCASASSKVRSDYDFEVDFSRYATYGWLEPPVETNPGAPAATEGFDPFSDNSLLDKRVRRAVDQQLASSGYHQNEGGATDFLVHYHVIIGDDSGASGGQGQGHAPRYERGTLFLDVIDASTKRIVWRGWTAGRHRDGFYTRAQLTKSVGEVMAHFPPKGAKPPDEKTQLRRRVQELEKKLQEQEVQRNQAAEASTPGTSPAEVSAEPVW